MGCRTGWTPRASQTIADVTGKSLHRISDFKDFDLSFRAVARIDHDEVHQVQPVLRRLQRYGAPVHRPDRRRTGQVVAAVLLRRRLRTASRKRSETRPQPRVREEDCVGCRLCYNVCPVEHCIEMVGAASGRACRDLGSTIEVATRSHRGLGGDEEVSGEDGD